MRRTGLSPFMGTGILGVRARAQINGGSGVRDVRREEGETADVWVRSVSRLERPTSGPRVPAGARC